MFRHTEKPLHPQVSKLITDNSHRLKVRDIFTTRFSLLSVRDGSFSTVGQPSVSVHYLINLTPHLHVPCMFSVETYPRQSVPECLLHFVLDWHDFPVVSSGPTGLSCKVNVPYRIRVGVLLLFSTKSSRSRLLQHNPPPRYTPSYLTTLSILGLNRKSRSNIRCTNRYWVVYVHRRTLVIIVIRTTKVQDVWHQSHKNEQIPLGNMGFLRSTIL